MTSAPNSAPSAWTPSHRSEIARDIWRSFGSGRMSSWNSGEMRTPAQEPEDVPFISVHATAFQPCMAGAPDWISELMARLDALLPDRDALSDALDADSLTMADAPAAFRMPGNPTPESAGVCLAAARVMLACREEILPPVFMTEREACAMIERASWAALMIGGEPAYLVAASILGDPASFDVAAEPADIEEIETE